uniref:Uncharacterized protein n=1 Tax=Cynoglossus semilaevis TaxID=244447 RepID=A0A3P8WG21_CYNSE
MLCISLNWLFVFQSLYIVLSAFSEKLRNQVMLHVTPRSTRAQLFNVSRQFSVTLAHAANVKSFFISIYFSVSLTLLLICWIIRLCKKMFYDVITERTEDEEEDEEEEERRGEERRGEERRGEERRGEERRGEERRGDDGVDPCSTKWFSFGLAS